MKHNQALWNQLQKASKEKRLGHAMLMGHDPSECEREIFFKELFYFCQFLQCLSPSQSKSCGECDSCKIYRQSKTFHEMAHPDLFVVSPENEGSSYSVDQIRSLSGQFSLRRALSPLRVAVIQDAEYLSWTQAAPANALLKLLEEPRAESFLILTTSRVEGVLKTLQSRCQFFKFLPESIKTELQWDGDWKEFAEWLGSGLAPALAGKNPADRESFWKDRAQALEELKKIFVLSFQLFREKVGAFSLEESRRVLEFLTRWQEFLGQSRFHIQGHLHWLEIQKSLRKV